mmetsp:Transcript_7416/g.13062  ORF Transcript_7416/g.13062 Transcript_7416/m.13062 type:complete len:172 (-) Transcript_7416:209-724(-)
MPEISRNHHPHPWRPVNSLKNARITLQIYCPDSGKRVNVPEKVPNVNDDLQLQGSFDDANVGTILCSTTLEGVIKHVKKDIPALYLWDEVGGAVLACGPNKFSQSEWESTMVWELIWEQKANSANGTIPIPHVTLNDGRDAIVITIGTPESVLKTKPTVVQRCLAKGDVYG